MIVEHRESDLVLCRMISVALSIRLYQSYNRDQTVSQLKGQVAGVAGSYQRTWSQRFEQRL